MSFASRTPDDLVFFVNFPLFHAAFVIFRLGCLLFLFGVSIPSSQLSGSPTDLLPLRSRVLTLLLFLPFLRRLSIKAGTTADAFDFYALSLPSCSRALFFFSSPGAPDAFFTPSPKTRCKSLLSPPPPAKSLYKQLLGKKMKASPCIPPSPE